MKTKKLSLISSLYLIVVLLFPQIVLAAPLTGANSDVVYMYKGEGGYEDETVDANDAGASGDVHWPQLITDFGIIGHQTNKFNKVVFDVSSTLSDETDFHPKYWNGSDWTELTLTGAPVFPFGSTGLSSITFTPPEDWAKTTVNDVNAYWIATAKFTPGGDHSYDGWGHVGAGISQISVFTIEGEAAVPEFTDWMYIGTIMIGGAYLYKKNFQESTQQSV